MVRLIASLRTCTLLLVLCTALFASRGEAQLPNPFATVVPEFAGITTERLGASFACVPNFFGAGDEAIVLGVPGAGTNGEVRVFRSSNPSALVTSFTGGGGGIPTEIGGALAPVGDEDNDGFGDFIFGEPWNLSPTPVARVVLVRGTAGVPVPDPLPFLSIGFADSQYGRTVSGLFGDGDLNGRLDFIVSAPNFSSSTGYVERLDSNVTGSPLQSLTPPVPGRYGEAVASVSDIDGDGLRDLVIGAPASSGSEGGAYLASVGANPVNLTTVSLSSPADGDFFGTSVASLGDVNGDGFDEFVVGSSGRNGGDGAAFVYSILDTAGSVTLRCTLLPSGANQNFGAAVAHAGDIDSDGETDILVGAPFAGAQSQGAVYIFSMSSSTLSCTPRYLMPGLLPGEEFGSGFAPAPGPGQICDLNNDSVPDFGVHSSTGDDVTGIVRFYGGLVPPTPTPTVTPTATPTATATAVATPTVAPSVLPTDSKFSFRFSRTGRFIGRNILDASPSPSCRAILYGRRTLRDGSQRGPVRTIAQFRQLKRADRYEARGLRRARLLPCYIYHMLIENRCNGKRFFSNVFARHTNCGLTPPLEIDAWEAQLATALRREPLS